MFGVVDVMVIVGCDLPFDREGSKTDKARPGQKEVGVQDRDAENTAGPIEHQKKRRVEDEQADREKKSQTLVSTA